MANKFKLHFNKVNQQRGNPNVWTVHTRGACIQAQKVVVQVPTETKYNTKRQPFAWMEGRGVIYWGDDGRTAIIQAA